MTPVLDSRFKAPSLRKHVIHLHPPPRYRWLGVRDVAATEYGGIRRIARAINRDRLRQRIGIPHHSAPAMLTKLSSKQAKYIGVATDGPFKPEEYRY